MACVVESGAGRGRFRHRARLARVAAMATAMALMAGCGGDGPASPASAAISLVLPPNPIRAAACPPSSCGPLVGELEAVGTLTVREEAGVAGTVQTVSLALRTANGRVVQGELGAAAVVQVAGSGRVAAGGALTIPVAMHFTPGAGVLPAVFTVAVAVTDDRGNRVSATAEANVI